MRGTLHVIMLPRLLATIRMSPQQGQEGIGRRAIPSGLLPGAESNVLTVRDLAEYLHCHYATVYRLIRQREFRASSQTVAGSF